MVGVATCERPLALAPRNEMSNYAQPNYALGAQKRITRFEWLTIESLKQSKTYITNSQANPPPNALFAQSEQFH
eukprot:3396650-Amphidinium_carterae.1